MSICLVMCDSGYLECVQCGFSWSLFEDGDGYEFDSAAFENLLWRVHKPSGEQEIWRRVGGRRVEAWIGHALLVIDEVDEHGASVPNQALLRQKRRRRQNPEPSWMTGLW